MIHKPLLAVGALIFAVLLARWFEEGDYYDPVRGAPSLRGSAVAPV
jgi:hypothetical protein